MTLLIKLQSAARNHLKDLKRPLFLKLAAEILAVDCGLKPCFLYDLSAASVSHIQQYLNDLQQVGFITGPLLIINMAETILIVNVSRVISCLTILLQKEDLHIIDVSAHLKQPGVCSQDQRYQIRSHLSDLMTHLLPYQSEHPDTISVLDIPSAEWNLCTMFGFLLRYPAVYWFDTTKTFDNCLSFTPLKRFIIQITCSKIKVQKMQIYSFTVPELIYPSLQLPLEAWTKDLRNAFQGQSHFTDLEMITETVTLPAVAL